MNRKLLVPDVLVAILVATVLLLYEPTMAGQDVVPQGLSASDWSSIRAMHEANLHVLDSVEGGYQARNPGQGWWMKFDGRGFLATPDGGGWDWGLDLVSYATGGPEGTVSVPSCVEAIGQRIEYHWDENLIEWYLNDSRGLEHGYTLQKRPAGAGPLQFTLSVRGDLRPSVSLDGRQVTFINGGGAAVLNYSGLKVLDATGASIPAWFEGSAPREDNLKSAIRNPQLLTIIIDDSAARYPLTIDPIAQQAYLKASNTAASNYFGSSVAISGDTVVVGAYAENTGAPVSGAAYVFVRSGGGWSQQALLKTLPGAGGGDVGDYFGWSVAISGDTLVIGVPREDSNSTGVNGNPFDNSATDSGAAWVFVRSGGVWNSQAYLKASNTGASDQFGWSVAISGDTIVVGAYAEASSATGVNGNQADNSAGNSGAAYVFVRSGTIWTQQAYLKASNTAASDYFGWSVAASGDTIVVGAYGEDSSATGVNGNQADNSAGNSGAAYVFMRSSGVWSQQAYLKASNTEGNDQFGISVAISGDTVAIGASLESSSATGVNGNQADNSAFTAGAAYIFGRTGSIWTQQAYVKASNTGAQDQFGTSVAVSGNFVVVGAYQEASSSTGVNGDQTNNSAFGSGAAYIFLRTGGVWSQLAYLKAVNTGSNDHFGTSVAVSTDTVLVGANQEASSAIGVNGNYLDNGAPMSGAAYVFLVPLDSDGDGVTDEVDVCPNNVPGLPVDSTGRPLRDCNHDCLVDAADVQCIVNEILGH